MLIRDILDRARHDGCICANTVERMRHDGCGGRPGRVELLTGIYGSSRPVRAAHGATPCPYEGRIKGHLFHHH